MPWFLRTIKKTYWYKSKELNLWLGENEIPADSLHDISTKSNKLSVWQVEEDKSNLNDIIIAIATNRNCITNFDYVLIDSNILSDFNIEYEKIEGASKYNRANKLWHYDLIKLTAEKLLILAEYIFYNSEKERINGKKVKVLFSENPDVLVKLDQDRLDTKVREAVKNALKTPNT